MHTHLTLTQDDNALILLLSSTSGCSLDSSPKKNWVERGGGLPNYICKIAKGIMRSGKPKGQAIAIAVSRVKKWAAGGDDVEADTQAKATKALAEWTALKARNKAKKVSLSHRVGDDAEYLMFSNVSSFNTEVVRRAFEAKDRARRQAAEQEARGAYGGPIPVSVPYSWIREVWTDHLIVNVEPIEGATTEFYRVDYTVDENDEVTFSDPIPLKQMWVEEEVDDLTDNERALIADLALSHPGFASQKIVEMANRLRT